MDKDNSKAVEDMRSLLHKNDEVAAQTRKWLDSRQIFGINLMGSPGSGKTTLLESLIDCYQGDLAELAVLEGDLETNRDADRIAGKGVQAEQICTGSVCHLSASMVAEALEKLSLPGVNTLFIENVGNLVCPSKFALGTHLNIVAVSVPEGDDKPIKYPVMIRTADIVVITKTDLLPYFNFNLERCRREIQEINPQAIILETAATNATGIEELWRCIGERSC
ncbi:MAG: hydrogenase accessory protein HypB [Desulfuromonas sp.]|nr:MAG: hydrogenase accessory protein HypB [Desulfuromonas sp.]